MPSHGMQGSFISHSTHMAGTPLQLRLKIAQSPQTNIYRLRARVNEHISIFASCLMFVTISYSVLWRVVDDGAEKRWK
jgi:hypothetical protein